MSQYVKSAPRCLIAHLENKTRINAIREPEAILLRLLTYNDMERVWETLGKALKRYESSLNKLLEHESSRSHGAEFEKADQDTLTSVCRGSDFIQSEAPKFYDGAMSDASYFAFWHIICDAIHDSNSVDTTPAQTRKLIEKTIGSIDDLVRTLKRSEILRRASDNLTWEIAAGWMDYPENISKPVYIKELQKKIDLSFDAGIKPSESLIISSILTYTLDELLTRFSDSLKEIGESEQRVKHLNNPRPILINALKGYFKHVLGENSNELCAVVLGVVLDDPDRTFTGQDMRA